MDPKRPVLINPLDYGERGSEGFARLLNVGQQAGMRTFLRSPQRAATSPVLDLPACLAWRVVPLDPRQATSYPASNRGGALASAALPGGFPVWVHLTDGGGSLVSTGPILVQDSGWRLAPTGPAWGIIGALMGRGGATDTLAYAIELTDDPREIGPAVAGPRPPCWQLYESPAGTGVLGQLNGTIIDFVLPPEARGVLLVVDNSYDAGAPNNIVGNGTAGSGGRVDYKLSETDPQWRTHTQTDFNMPTTRGLHVISSWGEVPDFQTSPSVNVGASSRTPGPVPTRARWVFPSGAGITSGRRFAVYAASFF